MRYRCIHPEHPLRFPSGRLVRDWCGRRAVPARREHGGAMILVMTALAVAFILGTTFLATSTTTTGVARAMDEHARARQVAESGLHIVQHYLGQTPDWRQRRTPGTWLDQVSIDDGHVTVTATFDPEGDDDDPIELHAVGRHGETSHGLTVILRVYGGGSSGSAGPVDFGIALSSSLSLTGAARIDSFDSSRGPYSPGNWGDDATVATLAHEIEWNGSPKVHGDLWLAPDADPEEAGLQRGHRELVSGSVDSLAETFEIAVEPPETGSHPSSPEIPNWGTVTFGSPDGVEQVYHWDELRTGGSVIVTIDGPVTIIVEGEIHFGGGSQVRITDNGSLTLYGKGGFAVSGSTPVNVNSADPERLTYYGLSSDGIDIDGSGSVYGRFIAPESHVSVSGTGRLLGLLHARSAALVGSGALHHDVNPDVLEGLYDGAAEGPTGGSATGSGSIRMIRWSER